MQDSLRMQDALAHFASAWLLSTCKLLQWVCVWVFLCFFKKKKTQVNKNMHKQQHQIFAMRNMEISNNVKNNWTHVNSNNKRCKKKRENRKKKQKKHHHHNNNSSNDQNDCYHFKQQQQQQQIKLKCKKTKKYIIK